MALPTVVVVATAPFTGVEDSVAVTWPAITGSFRILYGVTATDGSIVAVDIIARSSTGCTVQPSAHFTGSVELACIQ